MPDQEYVLGNKLLTYEWDISPDNGYRPAGLIPLSSTTVTITTPHIISDFGTKSVAGEATHNITLYRSAESGALVFGAGTVYWSFGLAGDMDVGTGETASAVIQQAMVNLFAEMGVQPESLQSGLVLATASNDSAAPTATLAIDGGVNTVEVGQVVVIKGIATDDDGSTLTDDGRVAAVEVSVNGGVTWRVAEGTTDWRFNWNAQDVGEHIVMVRAVDDSLNLQYFDVPFQLIAVKELGGTPINEYVGGALSNSLWGGTGQDWMFAGDGLDELIGEGGNDFMYGQGGQDWIFGGIGLDFAGGDEGNDFLFGAEDQDWIYGGEGDDFLDGGVGNDFLAGGAGEDTFYFEKGSGYDVIEDFESGIDTIDISAYSLNGLGDIQMTSGVNELTLALGGDNFVVVQGVTQLQPGNFRL